jgi:hypothetical protein
MGLVPKNRTNNENSNNNKNRKKTIKQKGSNNKNRNNKSSENPKKKLIAYKYSKKGTGTLYEGIILQGEPCFVTWYANNGPNTESIKLVPFIEEATRIIRPLDLQMLKNIRILLTNLQMKKNYGITLAEQIPSDLKVTYITARKNSFKNILIKIKTYLSF